MEDLFFSVIQSPQGFFATVWERRYTPASCKVLWSSEEYDDEDVTKSAAKKWMRDRGLVAFFLREGEEG